MPPHLGRLGATLGLTALLVVGSAAEAEGMVAPEPRDVAEASAPPPASTTPSVPLPVPAAGWGWPLQPRPAVLTAFDPPAVAWGSGHRGVDLGASVGQEVLAPAAGVVTVSGVVVDRGVVVVTTASGLRATLEPVSGTAPVGTAVARGQPVGRVSAAPGHCAPVTCLHWGVVRNETYLDPLVLIGLRRVVLLPLAP